MAQYTVQGHSTVRRARKGEDGTNAVKYYIVSDAKSIPVDADGNSITPSALVNIHVMKQVGSGNPVENYDCKYSCYTVKNGVETTFGPTTLDGTFAFKYEMMDGRDAIRIKLFSKTKELIDTLDITAEKKGAPGNNAVEYKLVVDAININRSTSGVCTPSTINVKVRKTVGSSSAVMLSSLTGTGLTINYPSTSGSGLKITEIINTVSGTIPTINASNFYLTTSKTIALYQGTTLIDSVIVTYTNDGQQGIQGIQGCILRTSEWATGVEYHNDEALTSGTRYIDIAVVTTGANSFSAYKCIKTHTSSSDITYTNTTYWEKFNNFVPIYTPLIMAQNALLRFTQTNQLLVMKSDNTTVAAGLGGGDYPLWVGAVQPTDAPFRVNINGTLYATDADIKGKITATSGMIGGWKINGNSLEAYSNDAELNIEHDGYSFLRIHNKSSDTLMSIRADKKTGLYIYTDETTGICLEMTAQSGGTAVQSFGNNKFVSRGGETTLINGFAFLTATITSGGTIGTSIVGTVKYISGNNSESGTFPPNYILSRAQSDIDLTLPPTSYVADGFTLFIRKAGSGNITVKPNTSQTMVKQGDWNDTVTSFRIIKGSLVVCVWSASLSRWYCNYIE